VSNFRLAQLEACMRVRRMDVAQYGWNMFDRRMQAGIFPYCAAQQIGVMAITVRTFFPVAPDYIEINAWALAPKGESVENCVLPVKGDDMPTGRAESRQSLVLLERDSL
jgi:hypothetical protein